MARDLSLVSKNFSLPIEEFEKEFKVDSKVTYLHFYWVLSGILRDASISTPEVTWEEQRLLGKLIDFGLVFKEKRTSSGTSYLGSFERYKITDSGKQFLIRLRIDKGFMKYEEFIYEQKSG